MPTATWTYSPPNGIANVVISTRAPQWRNVDQIDPRQVIGRTMGSKLFVYEMGPSTRMLELHFESLNTTERADIERFFGSALVNRSAKWFLFTWSPAHLEVIRCGASVGGYVIKTGDGRLSGERVLMNSITYRVRLVTPTLRFDEFEDGHYNLTISLEIVSGIPDNDTDN